MPVIEDIEEAPAPEEAIDHEELARLAYWHWETRGFPEDSTAVDWYWAEEELRRKQRAALEECQGA
jgi:Protein of unknown function (DUF2934)